MFKNLFYHSAILRSKEEFVSSYAIDLASLPKGISFVIGVLPNGKEMLYKIIFKRSTWSIQDSIEWVRERRTPLVIFRKAGLQFKKDEFATAELSRMMLDIVRV